MTVATQLLGKEVSWDSGEIVLSGKISAVSFDGGSITLRIVDSNGKEREVALHIAAVEAIRSGKMVVFPLFPVVPQFC